MPSKIITSSTPRRSPRLHKNLFVMAPKKVIKKIVKSGIPKVLNFAPKIEQAEEQIVYLPKPPEKCDSVCAPWSDEEDN